MVNSKIAIKQLKQFSKNSLDMRLAAEQWKNNFQILISIIMSARTRDEITIPTASKLFRVYSTPQKLSKAKIRDIEKLIRPVNFYKNKSKNIILCSKQIVKEYKGKVPLDFEKLIKLPGVGRKTANVFLSELGEDNIGIDTHVSYISNKMGWTNSTKQEKVENDLKKIFPKKHWKNINPILVRFGKSHLSRKKKDELISKIKEIK